MIKKEDQIRLIIQELRHRLGPMFPISKCDIEPALPAAKTIRNMKSAKIIPEDIFIKVEGRVLILSDPFLAWFASKIK